MSVDFQRITWRCIPEDISRPQTSAIKSRPCWGQIYGATDFNWECIDLLHLFDYVKMTSLRIWGFLTPEKRAKCFVAGLRNSVRNHVTWTRWSTPVQQATIPRHLAPWMAEDNSRGSHEPECLFASQMSSTKGFFTMFAILITCVCRLVEVYISYIWKTNTQRFWVCQFYILLIASPLGRVWEDKTLR
jgi:hypothetical protein